LIGSSEVAKNLDLLKQHEVAAVLNLTPNIKNFHEDSGEDLVYKRISIEDSVGEPIVKHFKTAIKFISENIERGKVLIHCQKGESRSPAFALAFAMQYFPLTLKESFEALVDVAGADFLKINEGFRRQLMEWDRTLNKECSIDLVASGQRPPKSQKKLSPKRKPGDEDKENQLEKEESPKKQKVLTDEV